MFFFKFEVVINHPLTHPIKYKVTSFAPNYKSSMANKIPSTNLEHFL